MTETPFVLDAYAARSCPLKTVNAFTPGLVPPQESAPPPPPFFHDADAIEADVFARLLAGVDSAVDLRCLAGEPTAEREAAALAAMAERRPLIVGPLLPRDWAAHRSGRPSLLLWWEDGYVPVQVKFHRVWEMGPSDDAPLEFSTLDEPQTLRLLPARRFRWRSRLNAALQVAHYWRLLEATGHAASKPRAGLVGLERTEVPGSGSNRQHLVITWLDLAAPTVTRAPAPEASGDGAPEATAISVLDRYDAEHEQRIALVRAAADPAHRPPLLPVMQRECSYCRWQEHCASLLDDDDLSKRLAKSSLDPREVRALRALGITTVADLAGADADSVLADFLPLAGARDGVEERLRLAHRRARLLASGVVLERITEGPIDVAEHELEIDLDIETSAEDHAYLWGFHVDDRATGERYYRAFARFEAMDADVERDLAGEAFAWLRELVRDRDAAVYHYSNYETIRLQRLAARLRDAGSAELADWACEYADEVFVDLFTLLRPHLFGAEGLGLKVVVAAATDFRWRDDEPGGLASQSWFADAVGAPTACERAAARERVLQYNEDDVLATWHLRAWLRSLD